MEKNVAKKKVNYNFWIKLLLGIIIVIIVVVYYFFMPVKNINVINNRLVKEYDILKNTNLYDYPKLRNVSKYKIRKNLLKNPLIENVEVKKSLAGKVTINVTEKNILFFDRNNNKIILGDGKEYTDFIDVEVPSLINYVPKKVYEDFIKDFNLIDGSIIGMISEIEYEPLYSNEKIIDEQRFLLRMKDGNEVYINIVNIEQLNNYPSFYATLGDKKGVLNLDSSTKENFVFRPFGSKEVESIES